jgi:hypothetical protein
MTLACANISPVRIAISSAPLDFDEAIGLRLLSEYAHTTSDKWATFGFSGVAMQWAANCISSPQSDRFSVGMGVINMLADDADRRFHASIIELGIVPHIFSYIASAIAKNKAWVDNGEWGPRRISHVRIPGFTQKTVFPIAEIAKISYACLTVSRLTEDPESAKSIATMGDAAQFVGSLCQMVHSEVHTEPLISLLSGDSTSDKRFNQQLKTAKVKAKAALQQLRDQMNISSHCFEPISSSSVRGYDENFPLNNGGRAGSSSPKGVDELFFSDSIEKYKNRSPYSYSPPVRRYPLFSRQLIPLLEVETSVSVRDACVHILSHPPLPLPHLTSEGNGRRPVALQQLTTSVAQHTAARHQHLERKQESVASLTQRALKGQFFSDAPSRIVKTAVAPPRIIKTAVAAINGRSCGAETKGFTVVRKQPRRGQQGANGAGVGGPRKKVGFNGRPAPPKRTIARSTPAVRQPVQGRRLIFVNGVFV